MKRIEVGSFVEDLITGFKGVVTGRVEYITGCNQVLVQPSASGGAYAEPQWIDEQRIIVDGDKRPLTLNNGANPGFGKQAPKI